MISKIYHISDVHIRTYTRHREYKEVFERVFKYIKDTKDEDSIIVLGGDIVHSKTDLSPELVQTVTAFLKGCADLLPTVLILGNHDLNLNNQSRLDALSPIVDALGHPNLHFWDKSGVYKFKGIHFSVFSVVGTMEDWIPADKIRSKYKIALHHGAVHQARTDLNYVISNDAVTVDKFAGFDLVLLGDIHQHQFLNDTRTIAYSSSLIQQNFGETLDNHGIIVWDVQTKTGEFINIPNDWGYYTFTFSDGVCTNPLLSYPKNLRVRVQYENTSRDVISSFIRGLGKKCKITEIIYQQKTPVNYAENKKVLLQDMRDVENQNQLITSYLYDVLGVKDDAILDSIRHINRTTNSILNSNSKQLRNITWKLKRFEFDNMFCYGEANVIDFNNFNGIYGLFAPNASGKSSIFDAITFALFDKTPRASKTINILNIAKDTFSCLVQFEITDRTYNIRRVATRKRKQDPLRVLVDFWYTDEFGNDISLNGKERDETNAIIREYIGTYEDFVSTAFSSQVSTESFINRTQRERKDLLYRFLDIGIFDDLGRIAKDVYRELQFKVKEYEKVDSLRLRSESENKLEILRTKLKTVYEQISVCKDDLKKYNDAVMERSARLHNNFADYDIQRIKMQIIETSGKINTLVGKVEGLMSDYKSKTIEFSRYSIVTMEEQLKQYSTLNNQLTQLERRYNELMSKKEKLSNDISVRYEKISHLKKHQYDPNCKYCVQNPFVIDATKAEQEVETLSLQLDEISVEIADVWRKLKHVEEAIDTLKSVQNNLTVARGIQTELAFIEEQQKTLRLEANLLKERLEKLKTDEQQYYRNQSLIETNVELSTEILKIKEEIKKLELLETKLQAEYRKLYSEIQIENTNLSRYSRNIEEFTELQRSYQNYDYYLQAISKDGAPYQLLMQILPILQYEINQILLQLVSFSVKLETTEDRNIYAYIVYDNDRYWPVEMTSGMERFVLSQAFRSALSIISSLPKSNFIAIDEGFGVLDPENLASVYLLFEHLKEKVDFVLCVSHIDSMRDMVDNVVTIDKIDGHSRVRVT